MKQTFFLQTYRQVNRHVIDACSPKIPILKKYGFSIHDTSLNPHAPRFLIQKGQVHAQFDAYDLKKFVQEVGGNVRVFVDNNFCVVIEVCD